MKRWKLIRASLGILEWNQAVCVVIYRYGEMPSMNTAALLNRGYDKPLGGRGLSSQAQPNGEMIGVLDSTKEASRVGATDASAANLGLRS